MADTLSDLLQRSTLMQPPGLQMPAISTQQAAGIPPLPQQPISMMPPTMPGQRPAMTAAPIETPQHKTDEAELQRVTDTGSGVSQLQKKHPILGGIARAFDIAGSALLPGISALIPGTSLHHQVVLNQDRRAVSNDVANEQKTAQAAEEGAQGQEALARADALRNPKPAKPENAGKTITTDKGIMQWNPATERYDIPAGNAPEKEQKEANPIHVQGGDGNEYILHPDGTATPVTANGQPLKGKVPPEKEGNDFEQFYKDYLADNKLQDSAHNRMQARTKWAAASQAPQRPPMVTLMIPDGKGGYNAESIHSGQNVAPGAVTPAGMNSLNVPTAQTRTMAETAPKVVQMADRVSQLVDQQAKGLGPAASRWSEFMAGKVGAPNPEFTKLRADVGLLQTMLMRMHVGARGGEQMMAHFQDLIDSSKQDPANLHAALDEIRAYAQEVAQSGHAGSPSGGAPTATGGGNDMIKVQIPGQAPGQIHASQKDSFLKKYPNAQLIK